MLFKNDVFIVDDHRYRLLHASSESNTAHIINLDDPKAWPVTARWDILSQLDPMSAVSAAAGETNQGVCKPMVTSLNASPAMRKSRDRALAILGDLPNRVPEIFDPRLRGQMVVEREQQHGHSRSAIYKNLRRFWTGGQTPAALLGGFPKCGQRVSGTTAGRGAKSRFGLGTYQIEQGDYEAFADIIDRLYLKDGRLKITHAFQRLLEQHYQFADGNGRLWVKPKGERPSLKQFEYFLRTRYSLEQRLRQREGEKDFERDHRAILGTVLSRCQGVGHQYEADATIADVYLVASSDRRKIVGKPTLYFIIDRKSRLIVGWYVGLENSSWVCAMQALLTVSMDKRQICERYGVAYETSDWPAHQVFPAELIADRELMQKTSDQIADNLLTRVVNMPAQRPEKKPVVETQFKLTRMRLQDGTPGFDPPENAKRRMGKHYEKDACLTLDEFTRVILLAIIEHNRTPMKEYELSLTEITDEVEPSPLGIWNHNIVTRTGTLTRFPEDRVRLALLPRGEATVTEHGLEFKGCIYTCPKAIERGWFVAARKRRFKLMVSYDGRLVDSIYVHTDDKHGNRGDVDVCVLTPRSEQHKGLSFAEVKAYKHFRDQLTPAIDQGRIQARADFHASSNEIIDTARLKLKQAGPTTSRTARKAKTKGDRAVELRQERQEAAELPRPAKRSEPQQSIQALGRVNTSRSSLTGQVVPFEVARSAANGPFPAASTTSADAPPNDFQSTPIAANSPKTLAEKSRLARDRMRNG